jgi:biopolymer transport protein ExbD
MSRVVLYVTVATITFIVGIAANWSLNTTIGCFAVDHFYCDAAVDVKTPTILPDEGSTPLPAHSCGRLVVSVTADGALDLSTMPMGTLKDTSALTASLRTIFERREELQVYEPSPELSSRVPEDWQIEKTVYIKAPRSMTYGEVTDLIAAIREGGGDPIGLINAQPQP